MKTKLKLLWLDSHAAQPADLGWFDHITFIFVWSTKTVIVLRFYYKQLISTKQL